MARLEATYFDLQMEKYLLPFLSGALFYAGWWGIVGLTSQGDIHWSVPIAMTCSSLNLLFQQNRIAELRWVILASLVGFLIDSLFQQVGVLSFSFSTEVFAPLWIGALWLLFASSFASFSGLSKKLGLAALLGSIGGPMSYLAGTHFHLVKYGEPQALYLVIHGLFWALFFPLMIVTRQKLKAPPSEAL